MRAGGELRPAWPARWRPSGRPTPQPLREKRGVGGWVGGRRERRRARGKWRKRSLQNSPGGSLPPPFFRWPPCRTLFPPFRALFRHPISTSCHSCACLRGRGRGRRRRAGAGSRGPRPFSLETEQRNAVSVLGSSKAPPVGAPCRPGPPSLPRPVERDSTNLARARGLQLEQLREGRGQGLQAHGLVVTRDE